MADSDPVVRLAPRVLPHTDLEVSRLGLGGAKLGGVFNDLNGRAAIELVQAAIDSGITFLDTSNLYAQGESEQIIGRAIADRRDQVTIASKAGYVLPGAKKLASRVKGVLRPVVHKLGIKRTWVPGSMRGATLAQDFASQSVIASVEQSLHRLATDHLDVLFLHSPSRDVLQAGTFVDAADDLLRAGKIRAFGVSCENLAETALALAWPCVSCVQLPLSVLDEAGAQAAVSAARSAGAGVVGRQCFAAGILLRPDLESLSGEAAARDAAERARQAGIDVGSFALGFSVRDLDADVTLVGLSSREQLRQVVEWANRIG
jgi:aryl-alcohol dehydrogenase-like predicted oxidoreductase